MLAPSNKNIQSQLDIASEFLQKIQKIIISLTIKYPQSRQEFQILLSAIKQNYNAFFSILTAKNKQLLSHKTSPKSDIKLVERNIKLLLDQMQLYFKEFNRYYEDPNFRVFQKQLNKIQDSFEFRNIDVDKFMPKASKSSVAVQAGNTWGEEEINFYKEYEQEIDGLKNKVKQLINYENILEEDNQRLKDQLTNLEETRKNDNQEFIDKINKLKVLLQNINSKPQFRDPDNQLTYRSQPEISKMQRRLFYHEMLKNTLEQMQELQTLPEPASFKQYNEEQWRVIFVQASALEQTLDKM